HTRSKRDWSSDVCSSDLREQLARAREGDVGADARRQEQAEDEQLPQRGRLVPERDRGLRGEGATVRVEEASGVFSLCAHAADPKIGRASGRGGGAMSGAE